MTFDAYLLLAKLDRFAKLNRVLSDDDATLLYEMAQHLDYNDFVGIIRFCLACQPIKDAGKKKETGDEYFPGVPETKEPEPQVEVKPAVKNPDPQVEARPSPPEPPDLSSRPEPEVQRPKPTEEPSAWTEPDDKTIAACARQRLGNKLCDPITQSVINKAIIFIGSQVILPTSLAYRVTYLAILKFLTKIKDGCSIIKTGNDKQVADLARDIGKMNNYYDEEPNVGIKLLKKTKLLELFKPAGELDARPCLATDLGGDT